MGKQAFEHYDFTSPWNIQVGIYQKSWFGKKEVDLKKSGSDVSGWEIMRHKDKGEIPDLRWRMYTYPLEYRNNVIKAKI